MDFFKANNYQLLFWPVNSPDLNPIEHLQHYVKQQLQKYETIATSMFELWERIQEVWNAIPKEICENLVNSMPEHMQAVKYAKGRHTKY